MARRLALPLAALLSLLAPCPPAWAGSPTSDLRAFFAATSRILNDPEAQPAHQLRAIRAITTDIFDVRDAAELSLGPGWSSRTDAEQDEFVQVFADFLERSFIFGVASRIRLTDGVNVTYVDELRDGKAATVRTTITSKSGAELALDYRMIDRGDRWAIQDVIVDGVSLAANYRAQFARVLQTSSYGELLELMRAKMSATSVDATPTLSVETEPATRVDASADDHEASRTRSTADAPSSAAIVSSERPEPEVVADTVVGVQPADSSTLREPEVPRPPLTASRARADAASVTRSYWVQLGAFKNLEAAQRVVSRERGQTSSPLVVTVQADAAGTPLARVRIGPFSNRAAAASTLHAYETRGYTPFIAEERR